MAYDELGVHHELGRVLLQLQYLRDGSDEAAVLGIVVRVDTQELRMLVDDAAVSDDDDGIGRFAGVPAGSAVGIGGYQ